MHRLTATLTALAFVFTIALPMTAFADEPAPAPSPAVEEPAPAPAPPAKTILVRPGATLVHAPVDVNVTVPDTQRVKGQLDVWIQNPPPAPEPKSWCSRNPGWCAGIIIVSTAVATGVGFGVADHYGAFDVHHHR